MSKKTLFLVNKLTVGGLEKVSVTIANELSKSKKIKLYSLKGDDFGYQFYDDLEYQSGKKLFVNSLIHPLLTIRAIRSKKLSDKKNLNFKKVKSDIDFTEIENVVLSEADIFFAKNIKKINKKIKIIGWIHSTYDSYKDVYMKDSYNEFLENLSVLDVLVVLTESDKEKFAKYHKNVKKINNPLTMKSINERVVRDANVKKIAFVGRLEYQTKGLDYLIRLAKLIDNDYVITIAGDGPDKSRFLSEIESEKLKDKFIFEGILNDIELEKHYLNSDVFILTSRWEGFGLVLTEAMNYSLPVISFNNSGPQEIIGENNKYGILIPNGDINTMRDWLNKLRDNKELYNYYSDKSFSRVKDFTLENIAEMWINEL